MRLFRLGILGSVLLTACDGGGYTYAGLVMNDFFPFDGVRTWEFISSDTTVPYLMNAELGQTPELVEEGVTKVYTLSYSTSCPAGVADCTEDMEGWVRDIKLSEGGRGARIHGFDSPETGPVVFEPPITLAARTMEVTDTVTTTTGGETFTTRFDNYGDFCDVPYTSEWNQCIVLTLCNGVFETNPDNGVEECVDDGDPHPLSGVYTAVAGYNIIAFELAGDPGRWQLIKQTYERE